MTDLDTRLHALADAPVPDGAPLTELRARADRRRHHRRTVGALAALGALVLVTATAVVAVRAAGDREPSGRVHAGPSTTGGTSVVDPVPDEPRHVVRFGDAKGTLEVDPATDLRDGDQVRLTLRSPKKVTEGYVVVCAADVTAEHPLDSCHTDGRPRTWSPGPDGTTVEITVPRVLQLSRGAADPGRPEPYDCATEPVGCVIGVGAIGPPTWAILVPVTFRDEPLPTPSVVVTPSTGLSDGQVVDLSVSGVRPNSDFIVTLCETGGERCDEIVRAKGDPPVPQWRSDGSGRIGGQLRIDAAIYGYQGRTDCSQVACSVTVKAVEGDTLAATPVTFRAGTTAAVPELRIEPPGPYRDGQVVTVVGTGFPRGADLGGSIGICPADKDPAVEERCGYTGIAGGPVVADDGTFRGSMRLFDELTFSGSCVDNITGGCYLGWILNHGPAAAQLPLTFTR